MGSALVCFFICSAQRRASALSGRWDCDGNGNGKGMVGKRARSRVEASLTLEAAAGSDTRKKPDQYRIDFPSYNDSYFAHLAHGIMGII